jgi:hypothetical protein
VEGTGDVARSRCWDTRRRKGETTGNPNFDPNRRASPRPYLGERGAAMPRATRPSESVRRRPRGAGRHRFLDDLLQFSTPPSGDEQPDADGGVARRHGQNRGGAKSCGYAAWLGQRKRVAHIPTAEAEAARSGLIIKGQGQARLHLKSKPPWSHQWGPVQRTAHCLVDHHRWAQKQGCDRLSGSTMSEGNASAPPALAPRTTFRVRSETKRSRRRSCTRSIQA